MNTYYKYCKQYKKQIFFGSTFKMLEAIFELFVPIVIAALIDFGITGKNNTYVLYCGLILFGLAAVGLGAACIAQYLASIASQGYGTQLRTALFRHINTLSYAEIDKFGTASLITRLGNDTKHMQVIVAMTIRLALRVPFILIGSVIMAFLINAKLAMIFVFATPVIATAIFLILKFSSKLFKATQKCLDKLTRIAKEHLEGARVVRAFACEESAHDKFMSENEKSTNISISAIKVSSLLNPIITIIVNIVIIALLVFGARLVNTGNMLQGEVFAFINYITQISLSLLVLANLTLQFTRAIASTKRVNEVLKTNSSLTYPEKSIKKTEPSACFCVKDLAYSYNLSNKNAVDGLNFEIKRGSVFGIIGGTGSGKTTLISLLSRLYDCTRGEILYCGNNIKDYSQSLLRADISIVPQNAVLFSGSLRQNLSWRGETSDADMENALKTAQIFNFISKNGGLDMRIDQGGKNFSGGQRQRLCIARALVKSPDIIILDDSSSALDFHTDSLLQKALKNNTAGATIIVISQRATSVKHANQILVLDNGKQVGLGNHKSLLSTCAVYKEIYDSQGVVGTGDAK